jgi:hypothetical protein
MNPTTLRRLSGMAAVAAGPLCILGGLLHPIENGHAHSVEALVGQHAFGSAALLLGTVLLLLGLPGVYGRVAPRAGRLGLIGFVLYFVGNMLSAIPHLVIMGFAATNMAEHHPEMISENDMVIGTPAFETEQVVSGLGLIAGLLILGIALLRDKRLPRWLGWTGVVGAVVAVAPLPVMPVVSGLQIELPRGALIIGLGLLAMKSSRSSVEAGVPEKSLVP